MTGYTERRDAAQADEAAVIHPGDALIIRYAQGSRPNDVRRAAQHVRDQLPADVGLIVIIAEQMTVYRPDSLTNSGGT